MELTLSSAKLGLGQQLSTQNLPYVTLADRPAIPPNDHHQCLQTLYRAFCKSSISNIWPYEAVTPDHRTFDGALVSEAQVLAYCLILLLGSHVYLT
jgi:hypothetical protein